MKCEINKLDEEDEFEVKFILSNDQLIALKRIIYNSNEDYEGNGNPETNFSDVICKAYYK